MQFKYAVIGQPIAHSLSPLIHQQFARQFNLDLSYLKIEATPENFLQTVKEFFANGGHGLNITYPFKRAALELAAKLTPRAVASGNINVLSLDAGDLSGGDIVGSNLIGDNTDGVGFWRALARLDPNFQHKTVAVLGYGNVARSILATRPIIFSGEIKIIARDSLPTELKVDWLIDSTPLTATAGANLENYIISGHTNYMNVNYGPQALRHLSAGVKQKLASVHDGRAMLLEQAAQAFFIWWRLLPDLEFYYNQSEFIFGSEFILGSEFVFGRDSTYTLKEEQAWQILAPDI